MSPQTIKCEPVADWSLAIGSKRPTVLLQTFDFCKKDVWIGAWNGSMRRSALSWFTGSNRNYIGLLHILTTILLWFLLIQYIYILIHHIVTIFTGSQMAFSHMIWGFHGTQACFWTRLATGHFDKGNGWKWMVNHWDWYRAIISEKSSFIMNWWVMMSHVYRVDMIKNRRRSCKPSEYCRTVAGLVPYWP